MNSEERTLQDIRFLAQERILDALLRTLALEQPSLMTTLKSVLSDTEFTHSGTPDVANGLHQQIKDRIEGAVAFVTAHGSEQS